MAPREGNSIVKHGVLDERLNVHGVKGLKVADLSICPDNVGCNTYSTALLIGEKCAVLTAEDLGYTGNALDMRVPEYHAPRLVHHANAALSMANKSQGSCGLVSPVIRGRLCETRDESNDEMFDVMACPYSRSVYTHCTLQPVKIRVRDAEVRGYILRRTLKTMRSSKERLNGQSR